MSEAVGEFPKRRAYQADYYKRKIQDPEWKAKKRASTRESVRKWWLKKHEDAEFRASELARSRSATRRLASYKTGARQRGLCWLLADAEAVAMFHSSCHYCKRSVADVGCIMGIDRKNNDLGYEYTNCVPCCKPCNVGKHTMPYEAFIAYLDAIVRNRAAAARAEQHDDDTTTTVDDV